MENEKIINKAYFLYLIQEKIEELRELDIDDIMFSLEEFLLIAIGEYDELIPSIIDFEIEEDGEIKYYELEESKNKIRECLKQIRNGDTDLLDKLNATDYESISLLADLFVSYYKTSILIDEDNEKRLKKQAIFYYGIQLGLSDKKEQNNDILIIDNYDIGILYMSLKSRLSGFIAKCYLESDKSISTFDLLMFKTIIPYSIENGIVNINVNKEDEGKIIDYIERLANGDCSLYDEIDSSEIESIDYYASLYLEYLYNRIYSDDRLEKKDRLSRVRIIN